MAVHRYWRTIFPIGNIAGPGREFITISECTMATTIGGATVCSGGTAFAGNFLAGFPASNAFDGSTGTFYSSNSGSANTVNNYLGYDFGAGNEQDIVDVRLNRYTTFGSDMPGWSIVQYSDDGVTYTAAWGIQSQDQSVTNIGDNLAAGLTGGARYQRVLCTSAQSGNQIIIAEIGFKTASGPGSNAFGFAFCARDINQDSTTGLYYQTGAETVDSGGGNNWYSANTAGNHWIDFDFGAGNKPAITTLQLRASANGTEYTSMPATLKLQASTDRTNWVDVESFSAATWTGINQLQEFTIANPYPAGGILRARVTMA